MNIDKIYFVYLILLFAISVVGFARFKHLSKTFKMVTVLILCTLISESIKKIYGKVYHNSMPVAHIWAVIEFVFFSVIYYNFLNGSGIKRLIMCLIPGMVVLEILNLLFFENFGHFPSLILEASHIVYVVYSLLLFRQMLLYPAEQSLSKQSLFWFNINMVFYATTMFLSFALISYFVQNNLDVVPLVYFSIVVNFIFYTVIGISLLIDKKKTDAIGTGNE